MAIFQQAKWRGPVPNCNVGGMVRPFQGLVLHIQEGTENGTDSWFHNPASQVSAHFGNPKTGGLDQWVDTNDKAWAQVAGNKSWISIENEGHSSDSLTASQIANAAVLLAWLNLTGISPSSGSAGETVVITGSYFTFATSVGFGNTSVSQMSVDSDTQITVTVPAGSGTVDVAVTTLVDTSATSAADQFTYS